MLARRALAGFVGIALHALRKIMRRVLRDVAANRELGDVSTAALTTAQ
jgi:hypothetical protein